MLRRIQSSSVNFLVLGASAAVFIFAFLLLQGIAAARTPETITLLVSTKDLQIGDPVLPEALIEITAFADETTALYVRADEIGSLNGSYTSLPVPAGHPIPSSNLIGPGAAGERFSAMLSRFPGHSLFPLPLDLANVVAPPLDLFRPGDLVGITLVIRSRPPKQATPTPDTFSFTIPGPAPSALPTILPPSTLQADDAASRGYPPLAKDLFPEGVRVVGLQGLPPPVDPDNPSPGFSTGSDPEMLVLLIENAGREILSLALQQGDRIFVSLLNASEEAGETDGFTYWDFEDWFLADRAEDSAP